MLRVDRSVIISEELCNVVRDICDFQEPVRVKLLSVGDNDHYLINSGNENYVLRIYRNNKPWLIKKSDYFLEFELLEYLKSFNIPLSKPIKRKDKQFLGSLEVPEGKRYFAVFEYLNGSTRKNTNKSAEKLGNIISRIHDLTRDFRPKSTKKKFDVKFLLEDSSSVLKNFCYEFKYGDRVLLNKLFLEAKSRISNFARLNLENSWGLIIGDLNQYNHLHHNSKIYLLDFDLCGYGWRSYDLATYRWSLLKDNNSERIWHKFLEGYSKNRNFMNEEIEIIPYFVIARQMWIMASNSTYQDLPLNKKYWDNNFKTLKKIEKLL